MGRTPSLKLLLSFIFLVGAVVAADTVHTSDKLGEIKCGTCPVPSPPPPPPVPSPPPPAPIYPPPVVITPPTVTPAPPYCPPPPPSSMYLVGPPGNLYPIDNIFNNGAYKTMALRLPIVAACWWVGFVVSRLVGIW